MRTIRYATAAAFARALNGETAMMRRKEARWYTRIVNHVERSMRFGSSVTGAPGQPYRSGNLRDKSFFRTGSIRERNVTCAFDLSIAPYAPKFEYPKGDIVIRSAVGGFHSVKITSLNSRLICRHELAIVNAAMQQ